MNFGPIAISLNLSKDPVETLEKHNNFDIYEISSDLSSN